MILIKPKEDVEQKAPSSIRGLTEKEVKELYDSYAKSYGDCEAPTEISARHGDWELVGHGPQTNSYCGRFLSSKYVIELNYMLSHN